MSELDFEKGNDMMSGDENISDDILSPHREPNFIHGYAKSPKSIKSVQNYSSVPKHEELYKES
jgi:hypothetical protein